MKRTCQPGGTDAAITSRPCGGMNARIPSVSGYENSNEPNEGA